MEWNENTNPELRFIENDDGVLAERKISRRVSGNTQMTTLRRRQR